MKQQSDTRTRIKLATRKLFAEKGVEAGTVRDVVAAAGAKNGGSLNYYFKSKDGLVTEPVSDVLRASTEGWLKALSDLDRESGPKSVRDVMEVRISDRWKARSAIRNPIPLDSWRAYCLPGGAWCAT